MSYKTKILSTFLISSIGLLPLYGSSDESVSASPAETPVAVVEVKPTKFTVEDGIYVRSPLRRGERTHSLISLRGCVIKELDPGCFMADPKLSIVSFKDSTVTFSAFVGGLFGRECPALTHIELTNTKGIDLKSFVENFADSGLLDLILEGSCKLVINRAPDDTSHESSAVYSDTEVQTMIRAFREVKSASPSTMWWLISKVTLGAVASQ